MAEKKGKKKQSATYCKEADTDFHKGADNAFTGGNAAYQPRDANAARTAQTEGRKKQTEKSMHTQQQTSGQKVQKSEKQQTRENDTFTGNKGTNSQSQDAGQRVTNRTSKAHAKKQMYQSTSGQKVQKFGEKPKQEVKTDFAKENNSFTGQESFSQPEETEKRQPDMDDYHSRDTYRQSQKKGKYHKKRVQKEYRG
ncbi:MAG: peptidase, partial [Lachnospiraceae bacterium]|nr:peptidase [Lachnospiraceae bacterium]